MSPRRYAAAAAQFAAAQSPALAGATSVLNTLADCSSGAHSLSKFGDRVYPEMGNGGYKSLHTDLYLNYDAITNLFLTGTHADLQVKVDPVPERPELRLRADERTYSGRHGAEHDRELGRDQRHTRVVPVRPAHVPGRPERPGRPRPRPRTPCRTRTR